MTEAIGQKRREELLADVAERRVPDVVAHRHRLDEVLVQAEGASHRASELRDLQGVRQPGAVVIADRGEEHLRLVLQTPERLAVHDAVAVEGERGASRRRILRSVALGLRRPRRVLREARLLELFGVFSNPKRRHRPRARELCLGACLCGHCA